MADNPATNIDYPSQLPVSLPGGLNDPNVGGLPFAIVSFLLFKNRGVYNGAFEFWITNGAPSSTPPSGHVVTDYCWEPLQ